MSVFQIIIDVLVILHSLGIGGAIVAVRKLLGGMRAGTATPAEIQQVAGQVGNVVKQATADLTQFTVPEQKKEA
jgi:hypothetical protein